MTQEGSFPLLSGTLSKLMALYKSVVSDVGKRSLHRCQVPHPELSESVVSLDRKGDSATASSLPLSGGEISGTGTTGSFKNVSFVHDIFL